MITRDTILAILDVHLSSHKAINGKGETADRILAAFTKERGKEVALMPVHFSHIKDGVMTLGITISNKEKVFAGKTGTLIFREEVK